MLQANSTCDTPPQPQAQSTLALLPALLIVGFIAAAAYSPIVGAYFRNDDFSWLRVAREWEAGTRSLAYGDTGVTLVYNLIYSAIHRVWRLDPRPYFQSLLVCHAIDCCLVMILVWLLVRRRVAVRASGLFFAALLSHHEAVTWPAAGLHVFVGAFVLAAVIFWVLYRQGRTWALPLSVLSTLLALFTKDSGVVVLPVLAAVDWLVFPKVRRTALLWHLGAYVILLAWRFTLPPLAEAMEPGSEHYYVGLHVFTNLAYAVPQMLVPDLRFENYLALLQQLLPPPGVRAALILGHASIILLAVASLWGLWRGTALVRLGILWCYLCFLPFAPFSYDYARAPRYLYVPSVGLALLVGLSAVRFADYVKPGMRLQRFVAAALVIAYLGGAFAFAGMVSSNRLRDSHLRRSIIRQVLEHVPVAHSGDVFCLCGLPKHLRDVAGAVPLYYSKPVVATTECDSPPPGAYVFRFSTADPTQVAEFLRSPPRSRESTHGRW